MKMLPSTEGVKVVEVHPESGSACDYNSGTPRVKEVGETRPATRDRERGEKKRRNCTLLQGHV